MPCCSLPPTHPHACLSPAPAVCLPRSYRPVCIQLHTVHAQNSYDRYVWTWPPVFTKHVLTGVYAPPRIHVHSTNLHTCVHTWLLLIMVLTNRVGPPLHRRMSGTFQLSGLPGSNRQPTHGSTAPDSSGDGGEGQRGREREEENARTREKERGRAPALARLTAVHE